MYSYRNIIPNNYQSMYRNNQTLYNNGDRFFLTPFLVGGIAGTALGLWALGASVVFFIGVIDGYIRPLACR